ncbi:hemolysin [Epibacterium sp. SM1979]|uniref:Hemolysin n=1 Tax=Tritonibacter litoralis TaxID=2662264 RepID=A0A843YC50_9RHOB|nr:Hint domain-containing protein [Tritonibacter litoralis]MQQ06903.1 hemolysin [Tritonibacter litoralis]
MPSTYTVLYLGNVADIDTTEGNIVSENASALVGLEFGDANNPLVDSAATWSAYGQPGPYYNTNSFTDTDQFTINGGPPQTFDATATYYATLTYMDGTTASITAVIAQDTDGNAYLMPEFPENDDQTALEAGIIKSISLDGLESNSYDGLTTTRNPWDLVTCFVSGTLIRAVNGDVPIEALRIGDQVITADHGAQPIRWIGATSVPAVGPLAPVVFAPNAIGNKRRLAVSPQHRMLVQGADVSLCFGEDQALLPAVHLVNGRDITRQTGGTVTYYHLLFDQHELIWSESCLSESFYPGDIALAALAPAAQREVLHLFPKLGCSDQNRYGPLARSQIKPDLWHTLHPHI